MWITKLRLRNIKSYGTDTPEINFVPGVNLIQGHNGAGKSTILEAIGLALFGSSPYKMNQIVREGSKRGEIAVSFISVRDEREYEVVRRIGGGTASVHDPGTGRKLCEGVVETADFVRTHLGVEPDVDLKALFEDAIGVPQGTMTAIFHEQLKVRKSKFDGLLRIDAYERVWELLRGTERYIQDLSQENMRRQATLQGSLNELPEVNAAIVELTALLETEQQHLHEIEERLQSVTVAVDAAQAAEQELNRLDKQLGELRLVVQRLTDQTAHAEEAVTEALEAASIVVTTAAAYAAYEEALVAIAELEADRHARDQLKDEQNSIQSDLRVSEKDLADTQRALAQIDTLEAEIERLKPLVEQQAMLENMLGQAAADQATYVQLQDQLARTEDALETLTARFDGVWQLLEMPSLEAGAAPSDLPDDLDAQLMVARDVVSAAESAGRRYDDGQVSWHKAQQELADLSEQVEQRAVLHEQFVLLQQERSACAEQVQALRLQIGQVTGESDKLLEYEKLLGAEDAVCPVCRRPMDEHAHADTVQHYDDERSRLDVALQSAQNDRASIEEQAADLQHEQDALTEQMEQLSGQAALAAAQVRFDEWQGDLDVRQQAALAALDTAQATLTMLDTLVSREHERAQTLADSGERVAQVTSELEELGDPHRAYERAAEQIADRPQIAASLATQQQQVDDLQAQLAGIELGLAPFTGLDERLATAQEQRAATEVDHLQYLTHQGTAEQLAERQADLDTLQTQYSERQAALIHLEQEHEALAAGFDGAAFQALRSEQQNLQIDQAKVQTGLKGHQANLDGQQTRLSRLEEAQLELETCEHEAARLQTRLTAFQFVRESIRQAGPQITRQLVQLVAEQANQIFGDILDDHSLILNWNDDYTVSVLARGEERGFGLLSGGEQMAAAIALRLALLTHLGNIQFAFFDEPTANLDDARRAQLAERLAAIKSLKQLFIISHDDTFEQESYHVVQVSKVDGLSQVEMR
ncbi:AAA family ATPase [Chloroflexota bacterium]